MNKSILSLIAVLGLAAGMSAFAADYVAEVNGTKYTSFDSAYGQWNRVNNNLKLLKDVTVAATSPYTLRLSDTPMTFDLGGHTLTINTSAENVNSFKYVKQSGAAAFSNTLTISNGTIVSGSARVIDIRTYSLAQSAKIALKDVTLHSTAKSTSRTAIDVYCDIAMTDCKMICEYAGCVAFGTNEDDTSPKARTGTFVNCEFSQWGGPGKHDYDPTDYLHACVAVRMSSTANMENCKCYGKTENEPAYYALFETSSAGKINVTGVATVFNGPMKMDYTSSSWGAYISAGVFTNCQFMTEAVPPGNNQYYHISGGIFDTNPGTNDWTYIVPGKYPKDIGGEDKGPWEVADIPDVTIEGSDVLYDGKGHGVTISPKLPAPYKPQYSFSKDGGFSESELLLTNACPATTIWVKFPFPATSGRKEVLTNATVTIRPREMTLTSATDAKTYDGTPLTNHNVAETGDGWATGEGASYTVTGSQTAYGTSTNYFTYALWANTLEANYDITKVEGTLTVTGGVFNVTLHTDPDEEEPEVKQYETNPEGVVTLPEDADCGSYARSGMWNWWVERVFRGWSTNEWDSAMGRCNEPNPEVVTTIPAYSAVDREFWSLWSFMHTWEVGAPVRGDVKVTLTEYLNVAEVSGTGAMTNGIMTTMALADWFWRMPWYGAFRPYIVRLTVDEGITHVGSYAFQDCGWLENLKLPATLKTIGEGAFLNHHVMKTLTVPAGVTEIGKLAFATDIGNLLGTVTFEGKPPKAGEGAFAGVEAIGYYPAAYATDWEKVIDKQGMWNGLEMRCSGVLAVMSPLMLKSAAVKQAAAGADAEVLDKSGNYVASGTVDEMMDELKGHDGYSLRLLNATNTSSRIHAIAVNATIDLNGKHLYIDYHSTTVKGKPWVTLAGAEGTTLSITNGSFEIFNFQLYKDDGKATEYAVGLAQNAGGELYVEDVTTLKDTRYPTIEGVNGHTYVNRCTFGDGTTRKYSGVSAAGGYVEVSDTTIIVTEMRDSKSPHLSAPVRVSSVDKDKVIQRTGWLVVKSGRYEAAMRDAGGFGNVVQSCTSGGRIDIAGGAFKGTVYLDASSDQYTGADTTCTITGGAFTNMTFGIRPNWSSANRFSLSGGAYDVDPSNKTSVNIQQGYMVAVKAANLYEVVRATGSVSVVAGNDKVLSGEFTIDGDVYEFGETVYDVDVGKTVTISKVECEEGYMPDQKVGTTFTVELGENKLTVNGVPAVADVYIEAGDNVYGGTFLANDTEWDFGETVKVAIGDTVKITYVDIDEGYVSTPAQGETITVPEEGLYITVTAEERQGATVVVKAGANVTGGKFTVGTTEYDFSATARDVPDGQSVTITSVNYVLGYEPDGTYKKGYSAQVTADATWTVTGKAVEPGEDPVLPQDVTPTEAGITNPAFADAQPGEVKEIVKWQATYQEDGANVNQATFGEGGKPTNAQAEGYLLDCAPTTDGIAEAKEDFTAEISFDAQGNPVVNVAGESPDATTYGNGRLIKLGSPDVTGPWSEELAGAKFFKFELVK